jgi:hypothetical protein
MRRPALTSLLVLALLVTASSCRDDKPTATTTSTAPSTSAPPAGGGDEALAALMLQASDLPAGFTASADVDDTITAFCATEDATSGLQASAREVRGFSRTAGGASVIQLAFRFRDDGATSFVTQAGAVLDSCSGVPDVKGLAFDYDPLTSGLDAAIDGATDSHVGRHGVNVGSGELSIDVVVMQHGDVGQLVAVLGLQVPRADLDALATAAFGAVAAKIS